MPQARCDPVPRPLYPLTLKCPIEALALFLAQFPGGPCEYSQQRWPLSLREAHLRPADIWAGEADRALGLLRDSGLQAYVARDHAAFLSLLAVMSASGSAQLLD